MSTIMLQVLRENDDGVSYHDLHKTVVLALLEKKEYHELNGYWSYLHKGLHKFDIEELDKAKIINSNKIQKDFEKEINLLNIKNIIK